MKKLILTTLFLGACAHQKPCVNTAPPVFNSLECQIGAENEKYYLMACKKDDVKGLVKYLDDAKSWTDETWNNCGPKKKAK